LHDFFNLAIKKAALVSGKAAFLFVKNEPDFNFVKSLQDGIESIYIYFKKTT